jgi:hypothetical protein
MSCRAIRQCFFTVYCLIVLVLVPYIYVTRRYPSGYLMGYVLIVSTAILDYFVSDNLSMNFKKLAGHGYIWWHVVLIMIQATITTSVGLFGTLYFICDEDLHFSVSYQVVLIVIMNLIVADRAFASAHQYILHYGCPNLHALHHYVHHSSVGTTYIIGLLDLIVTLAPGIIVVIATNNLIPHQTAAFYSLTVILVWYVLDHDEGLKLDHWFHHKYNNRTYNAYTLDTRKR